MVSPALKRVGLGDRTHRMSVLPSEEEHESVAKARSVVNEPPVILADESTNCPGTETGNVVMALMRKVNGDGPDNCSQ